MTTKSPNVLLVVLDDVRADHVSCNGYERQTTPCLEELAQRGFLFQNAVSSAGWTLPSHASLFTGMYPSYHGAQDVHPYLSDRWTTMAESFSRCGYRTIGISNNGYVSRATGLHRGFETFIEIFKHGPRVRRYFRKGLNKIRERLFFCGEKGAQEINRVAESFFKGLASEQRPFFMFINYLDAHFPFMPPLAFQKKFLPSEEVRKRARALDQEPEKFIVDQMLGSTVPGEEFFDLLQRLYDAGIAYVDAMFGQLLESMARNIKSPETIVVVCSDHGENLGEHGLLGHKFCLYDSLLRIPLIIHWEGHLPPGILPQQVRLIDLYPTLLRATGIPTDGVAQELPGEDLLSSEERDPQTNWALAEQSRPNLTRFRRIFPQVDMSRYDQELKALRTERWKYIWSSSGREELYDLGTDPQEKANLAGRRREKVGQWRQHLLRICGEMSGPGPGEVPQLDPEVQRHLEGLGYL